MTSIFRASVPENTGAPAPGQKVKTRVCDLDSRDPLWTEHKGSPFPTVAEAIQEDLDKYRYLILSKKPYYNIMLSDDRSGYSTNELHCLSCRMFYYITKQSLY